MPSSYISVISTLNPPIKVTLVYRRNMTEYLEVRLHSSIVSPQSLSFLNQKIKPDSHMPIPSTYDEQHRDILRSLAKYIERNNPHHPPFETIFNEPLILHRYVSQMRVNWLEVSSAVNIDRNRAYHWYYETHLRKIIDAKVTFDDKEIIRDMILKGIEDRSILVSDFQARIKSRMSKEYHRAEFTMTYNNILRSKAVKMAMMKAGVSLSGKKTRLDIGDEFCGRRTKGSALMYSGTSGASSPNYVAYNGQKTHSSGIIGLPGSRVGSLTPQSRGSHGDITVGPGAHSAGFTSTLQSHASTPGYYTPRTYGTEVQTPVGYEEGEGMNLDSHISESMRLSFPSVDIGSSKQVMDGSGLGLPGVSDPSLISNSYYLRAQAQNASNWRGVNTLAPGDLSKHVPLTMYSQLRQDQHLNSYASTGQGSMFPHRGNRISYESSPLMVPDNGTPLLQQPRSAGLYIENIPPAGKQAGAAVDDRYQYPNGVSYNGTSMSCNHSINAGYPSNMSNGGNSISNMGMCFQGQMYQVPSFLNFMSSSVQQAVPFGVDPSFTAYAPYSSVPGTANINRNDTPLSFGEIDPFFSQQVVKMPLEFLDSFSSARATTIPGLNITHPGAELTPNEIGYPGAVPAPVCAGGGEYNAGRTFDGNEQLIKEDKESREPINPVIAEPDKQEIKKDDFPWDQLGEKLKPLWDKSSTTPLE